jgi:hypothetical protein
MDAGECGHSVTNLGDDRRCCRRGRVEDVFGPSRFLRTSRHLSLDRFEVHIVWPSPHDPHDGRTHSSLQLATGISKVEEQKSELTHGDFMQLV